VVTTGGGNAANIGAASGRNDDGFQRTYQLGFSVPFSALRIRASSSTTMAT